MGKTVTSRAIFSKALHLSMWDVDSLACGGVQGDSPPLPEIPVLWDFRWNFSADLHQNRWKLAGIAWRAKDMCYPARKHKNDISSTLFGASQVRDEKFFFIPTLWLSPRPRYNWTDLYRLRVVYTTLGVLAFFRATNNDEGLTRRITFHSWWYQKSDVFAWNFFLVGRHLLGTNHTRIS